MFRNVLMIGLIFNSFQVFSRDSLEIYRCSPMSKDPNCWERNSQNVRYGKSGLQCASNGKVQYVTYHGEGSSCAESGKTIIKNQTRDWSKKTVYIETAWYPGNLPHGSAPRCHYWGPIYGGGTVDTYLGTWKVVLDGEEIGSYTYSIDTEQVSDYESKYIESCKITLN